MRRGSSFVEQRKPKLAFHRLFAMLYTIWCIIIGNTTPFPVEIDETKSVGVLKDHIKKKAEPRLDAFAAHELTLYKIDVKYDEATHEDVVASIYHQSVMPKQDQKLGFPLRKVSAVFGPTGPGDHKIHILVENPAGESIQ